MPTYARKHQLQGNLVFHILNRANAKQGIFQDDQDFDYFKGTLALYAAKNDLRIYHWVIMRNHYHILLEIDDPEKLSSIWAGLTKKYTNYFHRNHNTVGYLWQGRFKSQPVQKDQYLLACARYIERNPVEAGIVKHAEDYPHSSAAFYTKGFKDNLTCPNPYFDTSVKDLSEKQNDYRAFLSYSDPTDTEYFNNFENPVGDELFRNRLIKNGSRYMPLRQGRPKSK